jgi:hypothetical protein
LVRLEGAFEVFFGDLGKFRVPVGGDGVHPQGELAG